MTSPPAENWAPRRMLPPPTTIASCTPRSTIRLAGPAVEFGRAGRVAGQPLHERQAVVVVQLLDHPVARGGPAARRTQRPRAGPFGVIAQAAAAIDPNFGRRVALTRPGHRPFGQL